MKSTQVQGVWWDPGAAGQIPLLGSSELSALSPEEELVAAFSATNGVAESAIQVESNNQSASHGALEISDSEITISSLWGPLANNIRIDSIRGPNLIVGNAISGESYTCCHSICVGQTNRPLQHVFSKTVDLNIERVFRGRRFTSENDIQFRRMEVVYSNLHAWTYHMTRVYIPSNSENAYNIVHRVNPEWVSNLTNGFVIASRHSATVKQTTSNPMIAFSHLDGISIKHTDLKSLEEFESVEYTFRTLVNFLGECYISIDTCNFHELVEGVSPFDPSVEYWSRKYILQSRLSYDPTTNPVQYSSISTTFQNIVERWFELQSSLEPIVNLYLQSQENSYLDNSFITLMQALESYHRTFHDGIYIEQDHYDSETYPRLTNAIPQTLPDPLRQKLRNTLRYANEYSLRRRLTDLAILLPNHQVFSRFSTARASAFIGETVDTRNAITHQLSTDRLTGARLYNAIAHWREALFALILEQLGFNESAIVQATIRLNSVRGSTIS